MAHDAEHSDQGFWEADDFERRVSEAERDAARRRLQRKRDIRAGGEVARLRYALNDVRRIATLHFIGDAFDPEHMRSIANYCAGVIGGEEIPDDLSEAPEAFYIEVLRENGWEVRRIGGRR